MNKLVLKPFVEAISGGWQAKAGLHDNSNVYVACERFNAYDNKQEAWNNAKVEAKKFANNHNKTCNCGQKMIVGTY